MEERISPGGGAEGGDVADYSSRTSTPRSTPSTVRDGDLQSASGVTSDTSAQDTGRQLGTNSGVSASGPHVAVTTAGTTADMSAGNGPNGAGPGGPPLAPRHEGRGHTPDAGRPQGARVQLFPDDVNSTESLRLPPKPSITQEKPVGHSTDIIINRGEHHSNAQGKDRDYSSPPREQDSVMQVPITPEGHWPLQCELQLAESESLADHTEPHITLQHLSGDMSTLHSGLSGDDSWLALTDNGAEGLMASAEKIHHTPPGHAGSYSHGGPVREQNATLANFQDALNAHLDIALENIQSESDNRFMSRDREEEEGGFDGEDSSVESADHRHFGSGLHAAEADSLSVDNLAQHDSSASPALSGGVGRRLSDMEGSEYNASQQGALYNDGDGEEGAAPVREHYAALEYHPEGADYNHSLGEEYEMGGEQSENTEADQYVLEPEADQSTPDDAPPMHPRPLSGPGQLGAMAIYPPMPTPQHPEPVRHMQYTVAWQPVFATTGPAHRDAPHHYPDHPHPSLPHNYRDPQGQEHPHSNAQHPHSNAQHPHSNAHHPHSNAHHSHNNAQHPNRDYAYAASAPQGGGMFGVDSSNPEDDQSQPLVQQGGPTAAASALQQEELVEDMRHAEGSADNEEDNQQRALSLGPGSQGAHGAAHANHHPQMPPHSSQPGAANPRTLVPGPIHGASGPGTRPKSGSQQDSSRQVKRTKIRTVPPKGAAQGGDDPTYSAAAASNNQRVAPSGGNVSSSSRSASRRSGTGLKAAAVSSRGNVSGQRGDVSGQRGDMSGQRGDMSGQRGGQSQRRTVPGDEVDSTGRPNPIGEQSMLYTTATGTGSQGQQQTQYSQAQQQTQYSQAQYTHGPYTQAPYSQAPYSQGTYPHYPPYPHPQYTQAQFHPPQLRPHAPFHPHTLEGAFAPVPMGASVLPANNTASVPGAPVGQKKSKSRSQNQPAPQSDRPMALAAPKPLPPSRHSTMVATPGQMVATPGQMQRSLNELSPTPNTSKGSKQSGSGHSGAGYAPTDPGLEHSLEISPISQASCLTDRLQMTTQSPVISSMRDILHNLSAASLGGSTLDPSVSGSELQQVGNLRSQLHNVLHMTGRAPGHSHQADTRPSAADEYQLPYNVSMATDADTVTDISSIGDVERLGAGLQSLIAMTGQWPPGGAPDTQRAVAPSVDHMAVQVELDKEVYRRKHCEKQIHDLQRQLLEIQQQLAIAIATDTKKDAMISQLDKALVQVMENWKQKESDQQRTASLQQQELSDLRAQRHQSQQMIAELELELSKVADELTTSQQGAAQAEVQLQQLTSEHTAAVQSLQAERSSVLSLQSDLDTATANCDQLQEELQHNIDTHSQERVTWQHTEAQLRQQLQESSSAHTHTLTEEKARYDRQTEILDDTKTLLDSAQKDVHELIVQLDTATRDKDGLRVEMGLQEARHDSALRKQEADLQAEAETQVCERLAAVRKQHAAGEGELHDRHRRQIVDLSARHQQETDAALHGYHDDLRQRDERAQACVHKYEKREAELQAEVDSLRSQNRIVEDGRSSLYSQLQIMMQQHCSDTLRLLNIGSSGRQEQDHMQNLSHMLVSGSPLRPIPSGPSYTAAMDISALTSNRSITTTTSVTFASPRSSAFERVSKENNTNIPELDDMKSALSSVMSGAHNPTSQSPNNPGQYSRNQPTSLLTSDLHTAPQSEAPPGESNTYSLFPGAPAVAVSESGASSGPSLASSGPSLASSGPSLASSGPSLASSGPSLPNYFDSSTGKQLYMNSLFNGLPSNLNWPMTSQINTANQQSGLVPSSQSQGSIQMHPPVQSDPVAAAPPTYGAGSSGDGSRREAPPTYGAGTSGDGSRREAPPITGGSALSFMPVPVFNGEHSLDTSASSDWGYPARDAGNHGNFMSTLLQQYQATQLTPPRRGPRDDAPQSYPEADGSLSGMHSAGTEAGLDDLSQNFMQHESRQQELQKFIKMLLNKPQGTPVSDEDGHPGNTQEPERDAPTAPFGDHGPPTRGQVTQRDNDTTPPQQSPSVRSGSAGPAQGLLTPQQLRQMSHLLGLYTAGATNGHHDSQNPVMEEEVLEYLHQVQVKNESIHSGGGSAHTSPAQRSPREVTASRGHGSRSSSHPPSGTSRDPAPGATAITKHVVKIPSAESTSRQVTMATAARPAIKVATGGATGAANPKPPAPSGGNKPQPAASNGVNKSKGEPKKPGQVKGQGKVWK